MEKSRRIEQRWRKKLSRSLWVLGASSVTTEVVDQLWAWRLEDQCFCRGVFTGPASHSKLKQFQGCFKPLDSRAQRVLWSALGGTIRASEVSIRTAVVKGVRVVTLRVEYD